MTAKLTAAEKAARAAARTTSKSLPTTTAQLVADVTADVTPDDVALTVAVNEAVRTPKSIKLTLLGPNLNSASQRKGGMHVHKVGCADLSNTRLYRKIDLADANDIDASSLHDVITTVYSPGDFDYDPSDAAQLAHYADDIYVAPCVKFPKPVPTLTAKPTAKRASKTTERVSPILPAGYTVRWPHGGYDLARKMDRNIEGPAWLVVCNAHGVTHNAENAKEGDTLGSAAERSNWCAKCKTASKS